jgi:hypothetical protein
MVGLNRIPWIAIRKPAQGLPSSEIVLIGQILPVLIIIVKLISKEENYQKNLRISHGEKGSFIADLLLKASS